MSTSEGSSAALRHVVTAIVVSHNGVPWLDELVDGLREQRRQPDRYVAVDTGSEDESATLLREVLGERAVIDCPPDTGFGAAVHAAIQQLPPASAQPPGQDVEVVEWLWLLHDDCAPAPDALAQLLRLADAEPDAVVLGPKIRDWPDQRRLLEVGVTMGRGGVRETGLDYNEFDQGQHDEPRQVLAVNTAGMLVRRDVFEALGGFDPRLSLFDDDIDFGWRVAQIDFEVVVCPEAIVYHAEAGTRQARQLHAVKGRPRRVDRRNAIYTLLANTSALSLPYLLVRLTIASVLRVLGLLLVKWPDAAYDELMGWAGAFARPDQIIRARWRRRRHRQVPPRALRHLRPAPWAGLLRMLDALGSLLATRTGTHAGSARRRRRSAPAETGPVADEAEDLGADEGWGVVRWIAARPLIIVLLVLTGLAIIAERGLLGGEALQGGALLPAPDGASALWERYVQSWHPVELGSGRYAPSYLAVLAGLATVLLGKVWLLVDILVIGAVPLAGATAALLARRLAGSRLVRVWATVSYALLPAVTGAVTGGHLGTCVALIVLPLVALAAIRALGNRSWPAAFLAALALAVLVAFVPLAWIAAFVVAAAGLVLHVLSRRGAPAADARGRGGWQLAGHLGRAGVVLLAPAALLLPWTIELVTHPRLFFAEPGLVDAALADPTLPAWMVALGHPGGPGSAPFWLYAPVVLAAIVSLVRTDRANAVTAAWVVAGTGVVLGIVQTRVDVAVPWLGAPVPAWPGFAAALGLAGMIAAVACGADGVVRRFAQQSFSWRQPLAGLLAVVVAAQPLVAVGWWLLDRADGPARTGQAALVPSYVLEEQAVETEQYSLVVRLDSANGLSYAVVRAAGPRLGDAETGSSRVVTDVLDGPVADLVTGARADVVEELASFGIGYLYLPDATESADEHGVVQTLDTTLGLTRTSAPDGAAMWEIDEAPGRARLESLDDSGAVVDVRQLPVGEDGVRTSVPAAPDDVAHRRIVLAEAFDSGWRARLDGAPLRAEQHDGWSVAFALPDDAPADAAGELVINHADSRHELLLTVQGVALVLVLAFAIPTRARSDVPPPPVPARRRQGGGARTAARTVPSPQPPHEPTGQVRT